MHFSGMHTTSLLDYPGKICTTLFVQGCNLRCPYCHNSSLVGQQGSEQPITESVIWDLLQRRAGLIDGVCISGGEPLLYSELSRFIQQVKSLGYKVKLDTNGTKPQCLEPLLAAGLLDYVALDLKAPPQKYGLATGGWDQSELVLESIRLLRKNSVQYEIRTTVVPGLLGAADLVCMAQQLTKSEHYVLQQFRPSPTILDSCFQKIKPYADGYLQELQELVSPYVRQASLRGVAL